MRCELFNVRHESNQLSFVQSAELSLKFKQHLRLLWRELLLERRLIARPGLRIHRIESRQHRAALDLAHDPGLLRLLRRPFRQHMIEHRLRDQHRAILVGNHNVVRKHRNAATTDWLAPANEGQPGYGGRRRRAAAPRTVSHVKLFSGVVICARCDHIMAVQMDIGYGTPLRCTNANRFGQHNDGTQKKYTVSYNKVMTALHDDFLDLRNETTRAEILAAAKQGNNSDNSQEQLDALDARLKRLETAQQRIDSDYYIDERIDTARHTALSNDIARQVKEAEQQRTQLQRTLNEQYSYEHFAESLADTALHGLERLAWPVREANAWLRATLRIYVQDCEVTEIKYLPPNYML